VSLVSKEDVGNIYIFLASSSSSPVLHGHIGLSEERILTLLSMVTSLFPSQYVTIE
jgi:hypothetical protein